jgi:PhnB protein
VGARNLAPWIAVSDGAKAVKFYGAAFGAIESHRLEDNDGRVAVAHLEIGPVDIWITEDRECRPPGDGRPIRMILSVDDPDSVYARAVEAGAEEVAPVYEDHGWRVGRFADPFGHHWEVGRPLSLR